MGTKLPPLIIPLRIDFNLKNNIRSIIGLVSGDNNNNTMGCMLGGGGEGGGVSGEDNTIGEGPWRFCTHDVQHCFLHWRLVNWY